MPYLGNKPVNNFVSFAKQDITGNGGTSYSLDYPVTGANDIDLYINNVRQEPTEAYSCSGSTLTLTEAVQSTDDIYAIFRGRALQTAQHPSDSALEASQATISGEATITGNAFIGANGTAVPNANLASSLDFLQVGTGTIIQAGADAQSFIKSNHYWNGSSTSFQDTTRGSTTIRLNENNAGILQFETATSGGVGTSARLTIDASGRVTMPYQPAFCMHTNDANDINYTGSNQKVTATWLDDGPFFNRSGSGFSTSNSRFTAPIDGVYQQNFSFTAWWTGTQSPQDGWQVWVYVNGSMKHEFFHGGGHSSGAETRVNTSCLLELLENDYVEYYVGGYAHNFVGRQLIWGGHLVG